MAHWTEQCLLDKKKRIVDEEIVLIPYFPNEEETLHWYQDPELCKQVDNSKNV